MDMWFTVLYLICLFQIFNALIYYISYTMVKMRFRFEGHEYSSLLNICNALFHFVDHRQSALGGKMHRVDQERKGPRESRAVPAPDANAELPLSLQVLL